MRRSFAPLAVLATSTVLTIAATVVLRASSVAHDGERFDRAIRNTQDRIEGRLETYAALVRATAGLLAAHPDLTRGEYAAYVERLQIPAHYPGAQAVAFFRHVHRAFSEELVGQERGRGFPTFNIFPDYGGEEREVVALIEPTDPLNSAAVGYDLWSEPARREAIQRARDTGAVALTGKLTLVQETAAQHKQAGFILFAPVYRVGAPAGTVAERQAAYLGSAGIVFRADDLLDGIFGREQQPVLDFQLYDGPAATPAALLHAAATVPLTRGPTTTTHLMIFGRPWTISFAALPELRRQSALPLAPILLGVGLLLSLLLFALSSGQARAGERAEAVAAELRKSLEERERIERDLRESDRHKDEFLAVLGHELRNPLAPIVTALEVMRLDPASAPRQRAVIERQARHMVRLVDDLLDVSRISRGKIELRRERVSVREAISKSVETVGPLLRARRHAIQVELPARPLLVEADPVRFDQVLMNLLTNAAKYTPEGGHVRIAAEEKNGLLELRVSDDGIGFDQEAAERLFLPFEQLGGARDYAAGGLGIGLALVKGLVQLHGGSVVASSPGPGKGATFTVQLPGPLAAIETPAAGIPPLRAPSRPGRLLFVDDNVDAVETLAEAFRLEGHEVRVANDGPQALREVLDYVPEVIVLDIGLPGMSGYELAGLLRKDPRLARTVLIALTGFGQESDRQRARAAGFNEHLVKPVELEAIARLVSKGLRGEVSWRGTDGGR
jgi:signal transduction histidine kinase/ActR/RegA family two-component response regulator